MENQVTFSCEVGALKRRDVRNLLRLLDFHNPGRLRWIETKALLSSSFTATGDRAIIDHVGKIFLRYKNESS